eukprot:1196156-Prorocentrum_minimum.AAC.3
MGWDEPILRPLMDFRGCQRARPCRSHSRGVPLCGDYELGSGGGFHPKITWRPRHPNHVWHFRAHHGESPLRIRVIRTGNALVLWDSDVVQFEARESVNYWSSGITTGLVVQAVVAPVGTRSLAEAAAKGEKICTHGTLSDDLINMRTPPAGGGKWDPRQVRY